MTKKILSILVLSGFAINTNAQSTATATATATIITPISIAKTADMNFGNIAVSATLSGTVILAPDGTRTTGGTGVTLPAAAGTVTAAAFTVSGSGSSTYAITLPATAVLTRTGFSETMTASSFTSTPSGTGTLSGGTQNVTVGATLAVAAAQVPGTYSTLTAFDVTVNYN